MVLLPMSGHDSPHGMKFAAEEMTNLVGGNRAEQSSQVGSGIAV